jgi:hypothetical protein
MDDYEIINFKNYDIILNKIYSDEEVIFDNNEFTIINNISNIDNNSSINILKEMKIRKKLEHNLFINKQFFINDAKSSYKNNEKIFKQFKLDLPRCDIYINNHKLNDPEYFKYYLENKFNKNKVYNILILCTQTSLTLPFIFIKQNIDNQDFHLINKSKNNDRNYKINIIIKDNDVSIIINKDLYIAKINKKLNKIFYKVSVKVDISLDKNNLVSICYIVSKI